jgi:hypothetical protein
MERIIQLEARQPYRLYVRFDDGTEGEVDLAQRMRGPMFEPLKEPGYFAQVRLSDYGAPCWPNGLDLAPDAIHLRLRAQMAPPSATRTG